MRVWTIQPIEVFEILQRDDIFHCEESKIYDFWDIWKKSYNWMSDHLNKKDKRPENVQYPIWCWYIWNGKNKKPDLRTSGFGYAGKTLVCIELEIPDDKILVSDFDAWHYVLNNWYLDNSTTEEEFDAIREEFDKLKPEEQDKLKQESWEKIFDITQYDTGWRRNGYWVQGVFWELKIGNVKKFQYFKSRGRLK